MYSILWVKVEGRIQNITRSIDPIVCCSDKALRVILPRKSVLLFHLIVDKAPPASPDSDEVAHADVVILTSETVYEQ